MTKILLTFPIYMMMFLLGCQTSSEEIKNLEMQARTQWEKGQGLEMEQEKHEYGVRYEKGYEINKRGKIEYNAKRTKRR